MEEFEQPEKENIPSDEADMLKRRNEINLKLEAFKDSENEQIQETIRHLEAEKLSIEAELKEKGYDIS